MNVMSDIYANRLDVMTRKNKKIKDSLFVPCKMDSFSISQFLTITTVVNTL